MLAINSGLTDTAPFKQGQRLILGLGETGLACARYLVSQALPFAVMDSRQAPPKLLEFRQQFPTIPLYLGCLDPTLITQAIELIVSPGIDLSDAAIAAATASGLVPCSDIELFARVATAPIVAITGTNAKGTVVSLVAAMIKAAQQRVEVGGNFGRPALDLLHSPTPDFYILELSSFQLEATYSLTPKVATILNISIDHLDRHKTLAAYGAVKQRVYSHCQIAVWNRQDPASYPQTSPSDCVSFGLDAPGPWDFGLAKMKDQHYLVRGEEPLLARHELQIHGQHNWANALAALAIGHAINLPLSAMQQALRHFHGLPHRCQWVAEHQGVNWYNDSKATNVGATYAAIQSLAAITSGQLILIAGGMAKGADFDSLREPVKTYVKTLVLIGQDAPLLRKTLQGVTHIEEASNLATAVYLAQAAAQCGDSVLLSPACASLDMFKNYEERGEIFTQLVRTLY